jgi:hypothetical protein
MLGRGPDGADSRAEPHRPALAGSSGGGSWNPLAERLTTAEAHGEPWALVVRHADWRLELHNTDTLKIDVDEIRLSETLAELPHSFVLTDDKPVSCLEAVNAEVELMSDWFLCARLYNIS